MKINRIFGLATAVVAASSSMATVQNFDSLSSGVNASNALPGLTLICGESTDVTTVGDTLTYSPNMNGFHVYSDPNTAWSGDNVAFCPGTNDLLIQFDVAVLNASVLSDRFPNDGSDTIRLAALKALGNDQYEVLDIYSTTDDFTDGVGNLMSVSVAGGFEYLAFLTTTEQEGFDDLTYEAVPEPATLAILGGLALVARRRKTK